MAFPVIGGSQSESQYLIDNSLRFNDAEDTSLLRTGTSGTLSKAHTFSAWIKRDRIKPSGRHTIIGMGDGSGNISWLMFNNDSLIYYATGSGTYALTTTAKYRDLSAWYHVVAKVDTTQSTASDRFKFYVNGVEQAFTGTILPQNHQADVDLVTVGFNSSDVMDGYMSEIHFLDGVAYDPTYFGEFDSNSGIWKPIEYTGGNYGTFGFYLDFKNSGNFGADQSGNGNNFTASNFTSTDQTTDTPTNNFATLNPLANQLGTALSEGNLQQSDTNNDKNCFSTFGLNTGKWYFEVKVPTQGTRGNILITDADHNEGLGTNYARVELYNGNVSTSATDNGNISSFSNNDILCVALDLDNGQVWFSKNANINTGTTALVTNLPLTGTNRDYRVSHFGTSTGTTVQFNFGNPPFSITSGNTDDNGYGNFEYAPPSGYLALCTQNLATALSPTIDDGSQYFETTAYTGNASTLAITSLNFQPDFLWIKRRSSASTHALFNSTVGRDKSLGSESNDAEYTSPSDKDLISFDSNGFTVAQPSQRNVNGSGQTFVGWSWKANSGTTSSNTDGSITSTVQANTTAGFSIVTGTSPSSGNWTAGHGLGSVPEVIILKGRSAATNWHVYHKDTGALGATFLNLNNAFFDAEYFGDTTPTSTVFYQTMGSAMDGDTTFVAYCFKSIEGYSKFGSYTGNGSSDGTFVYTGFRPAFVLTKRTDSTSDWHLDDSARDTFNVTGKRLFPNLSNAEDTGASRDFLSNGFKIRNTFGGQNTSGGTYIYMAFAENPFVTSGAVPVTAR